MAEPGAPEQPKPKQPKRNFFSLIREAFNPTPRASGNQSKPNGGTSGIDRNSKEYYAMRLEKMDREENERELAYADRQPPFVPSKEQVNAFRGEARELINGNKGESIVIIIDDQQMKIDYVEKEFQRFAQKGLDIQAVSKTSGTDGVSLYQALREAGFNGRIIAVLDGFLDGTLNTGVKVARSLGEVSRRAHHEVPFIIGESSDKTKNGALKLAYPEQFIGVLNYDTNEDELLEKIRAKLNA